MSVDTSPPRNPPDTVDDVVDTPYTVKKPSSKHPHNWKRADVLTFLNANKEGYDIDDKHIKIIEDSQLAGRGFLKLTEEKLVRDYGLPRGAAITIEDLIYALKPKGIKCRCKFIYGRDTKTTTLTRAKEEFSENLFRNEALNLFEFPEGTETSDLTLEAQEGDNKKQLSKLDQSSLQDVAESGSITLVITTRQRPFSSWTFNEFKAQFNIEADNYGGLSRFTLPSADLSAKKIAEHIDDALKEVMKIYRICPDGMTGNESNRSLFVFEILKQTTSVYDGFHLKSQKHVSGNLGSGPVDFAIEHAGALIMVTEAKRENIDQGVAQCAIQLDCSGKINSKRKRQEGSDYEPQQLYGIVTTGNQWVFIRLEKKSGTDPKHSVKVHKDAFKLHVEVEKEAPVQIRIGSLDTEQKQKNLREDITTLFEYILSIYQEVEASVRAAKRQKTT